MKAKKLIEVAMPIKEISAESVRDNRLAGGNIRTLHIWWARRPLPTCRAVVFASLVPDPLDEYCPQAFMDAVADILMSDRQYAPYKDIPYTAAFDPMEDNMRNRLMMFIGKFSPLCQENMKVGKKTAPADQLTAGSLIKWENHDNKEVLEKAQKLIWIAYNSEMHPDLTYASLASSFEQYKSVIEDTESELYGVIDRHKNLDKVHYLECKLQQAIEDFQNRMPAVFDPFAGGGAIPLEAARLGCRSFGNDINPVAHIVEKGSAELPQRFGKPIKFTTSEFIEKYGDLGVELFKEQHGGLFSQEIIEIDNSLAFDFEYYARQIIARVEQKIGHLYPKDRYGNTAVAYYWGRTARCSNPACGAEVPMLRNFYLANTSNKHYYLNPHINDKTIKFELKTGKYDTKTLPEWNHRGVMTCPCCGSVTESDIAKAQSVSTGLKPVLLAVIAEDANGKVYSTPDENILSTMEEEHNINDNPREKLAVEYTQALPCCLWGFTHWGDLFSNRQLYLMNTVLEEFEKTKASLEKTPFTDAVITYLAIWIDRIALFNTTFSRWNDISEKFQHLFGRQAIPMLFDYAESNPFCHSSGSAYNQIDWIVKYLNSESFSPFSAVFANSSSGDKLQFERKSLTAVVTDPPYYDAISYADCSDFFYVWLKRTLNDIYPLNFSTPQTPKTEECTALKHRFSGSENKAKKHFENKLTDIFDAIEAQTSDIVSIMYAHQSTEAWTTLCNSILDARMNITGSWSLDTEMAGGLKTDKAYLESSVTVSCRPSERKGFGDYKDVKKAIVQKVSQEVEDLYALGFRGADLLTACFGQAVSEFGKYKVVEKADGSEVQVAELLDMARTTAFNSLLQGVQGDDFTRFYIGWLQMNGMGETDFDDATKFTRVGMPVDVSEIFARKLLIREGKKQHLATAAEHLGNSSTQGTHPEDSLIDQVHRAMLAYEKGDRHILLTLLHNVGADDQSAPFWRLVASLKELLPDGKDLKAVEGLLGNSDNLRQESREVDQHQPEQMTLDFGGDFNNDFK